MYEFFITVMILWIGWRSYQNARHDGTWSNKLFFMALLGVLGLCAVIVIPVIFISPSTLQAHEVLAVVCLLVVIAIGDTLLALYLKRWRKRNELKQPGQTPAV